MATQKELLPNASFSNTFSFFRKECKEPSPKKQPVQARSFNKHLFEWTSLSSTFPLVHLVQPDFYAVFRFSAPTTPVYQQNLCLDLGSSEVAFETIHKHIAPDDLQQLCNIDRVMNQFAVECRLQPFDYICSVMLRWNHPSAGQRYFIRKTTVLQSDARGIPSYGIMTIKDVTPMVSAIKPNNADVTFRPEKANLCTELCKRMKAVKPKQTAITGREKEIVRCLCKGMSSKEIAAALFISKATVDTHRQNLIHKWEVPNTAALLQRAMAEGCI